MEWRRVYGTRGQGGTKMTKQLFQKEMIEFAKDNGIEWAEEYDDHFVLYSENNYIAVWLVEDGSFAVESDDYTQTFDDIEGAKEDILQMIDVIREQEG